MIQLAYRSRSLIGRTSNSKLQDLRKILGAACANNERDQLTGFLLFDRDWFIQVLEGETHRVRATFNRIQRDPRHSDVSLISEREVRSGAWD